MLYAVVSVSCWLFLALSSGLIPLLGHHVRPALMFTDAVIGNILVPNAPLTWTGLRHRLSTCRGRGLAEQPQLRQRRATSELMNIQRQEAGRCCGAAWTLWVRERVVFPGRRRQLGRPASVLVLFIFICVCVFLKATLYMISSYLAARNCYMT